MNEDDRSDLPAKIEAHEIVVSFHDNGLLVGGDPSAVESYLARLRTTATRALQVSGIDGEAIANAAGVAAGLAAIFGSTGKYVQLHPDSWDVLKAGNVVPGTDGFFRMMTRGGDGKFVGQLQWRPTAFGPEVMLSAQMIAVQVALKSAIAQVEEAVRRVEGRVESILELAKASQAGDVIGNNVTISRMVESLERYESLPNAYWDSVASLGPALNVTVEQLRSHVRLILASFDQSQSVQERADKLKSAFENSALGDTLSLLVIAEESLHKWQRLNLARIKATEPEHLLRAIDEARELVEYQFKEDAEIYCGARQILSQVAKPQTIEGLRFVAVQRLARYGLKLRGELDRFAEARGNQLDTWDDFHIPSFLDGANAALEIAKTTTGRAIAAAGQGLIRLGEQLTEPLTDEKLPEPRKSDPSEEAGT